MPLPAPPQSALGYVAPGFTLGETRAGDPDTDAPRQLRRESNRGEAARQGPARQPAPSSPTATTRTTPAKPVVAPPVTPVDETVYADFAEQPPAPADAATRVYSAEDPDVQPPVAGRAWFFTSPPEGISRSSLTQIEVVVSPKGDVESAKIVGGPRTYTDGMILSAIKGGKFRPAQKDGQPVTYRQTLWVVVPDR